MSSVLVKDEQWLAHEALLGGSKHSEKGKEVDRVGALAADVVVDWASETLANTTIDCDALPC